MNKMRRMISGVLVFCLVSIMVCLGNSGHVQAETAATVTIDTTSIIHPSIGGVGFHVQPYWGRSENIKAGINQDAIDTVIQKRWQELNPGFARVQIGISWWEPQEGTKTWDSEGMQSLYKALDMFKNTDTEVYMTLWYHNPDMRPEWLGGGTEITDEATMRKLARTLTDFFDYIINTKGYTNVKYFCIANEFSAGGAHGNFSLEGFKRHNEILAAELQSRNLNDDIKLMATDAIFHTNTDTFVWAAENMDEVIDIYGGHYYLKNNLADPAAYSQMLSAYTEVAQLARQKGKDFILGEFGSSQYASDRTLYGLSIAEHVIAAINSGIYTAASWNYFDLIGSDNWQNTVQDWGLFDDITNGFKTYPHYYSYGLLTKYIRPDSKSYQVNSSDDNIRVAAVQKNDDSRYTIALVSRSENDTPVSFNLSGETNSFQLRKYVYNINNVPENDYGDLQAYSSTVQVSNGSFQDTVEGNSVVVYVQEGGSITTNITEFSATPIQGAGIGLSWNVNDDSNVTYYRIHRSETQDFVPDSSNQIVSTIAKSYTDNTNLVIGKEYYYKITAVNDNGDVGEYLQANAVVPDYTSVFTDHLNDWLKPIEYSENLVFDSSNYTSFDSDYSRVYKADSNTGFITYNLSNITNFSISTYNKGTDFEGKLSVSVSNDNQSWSEVTLTNSEPSATYDGWYNIVIGAAGAIPDGNHYLKLELKGTADNNFQLSHLDIMYSPTFLTDTNTGGNDITSPEWSSTNDLMVEFGGKRSVVLKWNPATDNIGVVKYKLYQNDVEIAELEGSKTDYMVKGLTPGTKYNFKIEAYDEMNNVSSVAPSVTYITGREDTPAYVVIEDQMLDYSKMDTYSLGWQFVNRLRDGFGDDASTIRRVDDTQEEFTYHIENLTKFDVDLFYDGELGVVQYFVSQDGADWEEVQINYDTPVKTSPTAGWYRMTGTFEDIGGNYNYLKVKVVSGRAKYTPQIGKVYSYGECTSIKTITDEFLDFSKMDTHTYGWNFINKPRAPFANDPSTMRRVDNTQEEITYYLEGLTKFGIDLFYYQVMADVKYFVSENGENWQEVQVNYNNPVATASGWYQMSGSLENIQGNNNYLKIQVVSSNEKYSPQFGKIVIVAEENRNSAPVLSTTETHSVDEGQELTFTVTVTDPEGDEVTLSAEGLPEGAAFNTASGLFRWTPSYEQSGAYTVTITATDKLGLSSSMDVVITVNNVNRAPKIQMAFIVDEGQEITFRAIGKDPDDDGVMLTTVALPEGAEFDLTTGVLSWTPTYEQSGEYVVTLQASDGALTNTVEADIIVNDVSALSKALELKDYINTVDLDKGEENSLITQIESAIDSIEKGQVNTAANKMKAFINHVEAQRNKKLSSEQASKMVEYANIVIHICSI